MGFGYWDLNVSRGDFIILRKLYKKHKEKIRFLIAGAWNTLFGYLSFMALYFLLVHLMNYMFIFIISAAVNIIQNFWVYKIFVFKTKGNHLKEFLRFNTVYAFSIGLNFVLLPFFVEVLKMHPLIAQACLIFLIVVISYIGHRNFSFRREAK